MDTNSANNGKTVFMKTGIGNTEHKIIYAIAFYFYKKTSSSNNKS